MLAAGTQGGARAFGFGSGLGVIERGALADLVAYRLDSVPFTPLHDPVRQLIYAERGADIDFAMVNGDVALRDGQFTRVDEARLLAEIHGDRRPRRTVRGVGGVGGASPRGHGRALWPHAAGGDSRGHASRASALTPRGVFRGSAGDVGFQLPGQARIEHAERLVLRARPLPIADSDHSAIAAVAACATTGRSRPSPAARSSIATAPPASIANPRHGRYEYRSVVIWYPVWNRPLTGSSIVTYAIHAASPAGQRVRAATSAPVTTRTTTALAANRGASRSIDSGSAYRGDKSVGITVRPAYDTML